MTGPETRKLHLRIPFRMELLYASRRFYTGFGIVMAAFMLYGPIPARAADHNGYRYLLGPLVCPVLAALCSLLFPLNPYRSRFGSVRGLYRLDERDEGARLLVELLRSDDCRQVTVVAAAKSAAVLLPIMAVFALVFRQSLNWNLHSPWQGWGIGGGTFFSWIMIRVQVLRWALTSWWKESGSSRAA
jgi:hypothetical protein